MAGFRPEFSSGLQTADPSVPTQQTKDREFSGVPYIRTLTPS